MRRRAKNLSAGLAVLLVLLAAVSITRAQDDEDEYISPVRPSISESASIQKKGVLQLEYGVHFDYRSPEYRNHQTGPLGVYFAASDRLRLDLEFETFASQEGEMHRRESGIGDVNLGFKAIARDKPKEHLAVALAYSAKLPTASERKELGTGRVDHDLRLILDRTYGKNEFVANFAYLNVGREDSNKRASGAQLALMYDRELTKKFGLETELIGNSVDTEQPRGAYSLVAVTYKASKRTRFDWGVRPGFGPDAPKMSFFFGVSTGVAKLYRD